MKLDRRSSLADVAVTVGDALRRRGIKAVLTGGACADLYAEGAYPSFDADFILSGPCETADVDQALAPLGFFRTRDHYAHRRLSFIVEFPAGPLGIGQDSRIRPVMRTRKGARTLALSVTDACRDRLASFYFWSDRQSLAAAVAIALRHRVSLAKIQHWSRAEGHLEGYEAFLREVRRVRSRKRRPAERR